jgi:DNA-binding transcriptional regulator YhcF (GntR family)
MDIKIDADSAVPPYEQVRLRIAELAAGGVLAAGAKLPPVRQLAGELGLAANTVARAYRELEQAGLVETRGRAGTLVTAAGDARREAARAAASAYVSQTRRLGLTPDEILALVRAQLT